MIACIAAQAELLSLLVGLTSLWLGGVLSDKKRKPLLGLCALLGLRFADKCLFLWSYKQNLQLTVNRQP